MLPSGTENLFQFSGRVVEGLQTHGPWIGLGWHSAIDLRSKIERLRQFCLAADTARTTRDLAVKRVALAERALKTWLEKARLVVMLARGARWSESWIPTGFIDARMRVPKNLEDRISLARKLVSFFARHPEFGVNFAEVTAARGRAIYERVLQSRQMLQLAQNDCALTKAERAAAEKDLRLGLRSLVSSLKVHFDGSDPRWADFGLVQAQSRKRSRRSVIKVKRADPIPFVSPADGSGHQTAAA